MRARSWITYINHRDEEKGNYMYINSNFRELFNELNKEESPWFRADINPNDSNNSFYFDKSGNSVLLMTDPPHKQDISRVRLESPSSEDLERLAHSLGLPFRQTKLVEPTPLSLNSIVPRNRLN